MERKRVIEDLGGRIETLTRLHIRHGLHTTGHFQAHKQDIADYIREHEIDIRTELDPISLNLYRRYFE